MLEAQSLTWFMTHHILGQDSLVGHRSSLEAEG